MFKRYFQYVVYLVLVIGFSSAKAGAYEDFFKSVINDDARQVEQLSLQLQMLRRWAEDAGQAGAVSRSQRPLRGRRALSKPR